mgnify:CR=1 FL=1
MQYYDMTEEPKVVEEPREKKGSYDRDRKMSRIYYQMNFLNSMDETEEGPLIDALVNSKELAIFGTDLIHDLIDFRWQQFAGPIHKIGFAFHIGYIMFLSLYINQTYLKENSSA